MRHILHFILILSIPLFSGFTFNSASASAMLPVGEGCPKPNQIKVEFVTDTSAVVSWQESEATASVRVLVTSLSDPTMVIEYNEAESPLAIGPLSMCESYTLELMTVCDDTTSEYTRPLIFESDGCCRIPTAFASTVVSDTFASFSWDQVVEAEAYAVRYKLSENDSEAGWIRVTTTETSVTLDELNICAAYDVQIQTLCHGDSTGFSESFLLQTLGCGVCTALDYCSTGGIDANSSWIDIVSFANFQIKSGFNDGYFAYTTEQTALERGRSYDFFVTPGFAGDTTAQYIRVWMDLDHDGIFNDSSELLLDTIDVAGFGMGSSFMVADTLPRDITRLRVAMKTMADSDTIGPDPCGLFNFGEVEDYCIRIDEPCPPAENVDTLLVTTNSATVFWDSDTSAFGYIYSYNIVGEEEGDEEITGDTIVKLTELKGCSEYAFKIISVCEQDTNTVVFLFKTLCETAVEDLAPLVRGIKIYPNPFSTQFHMELEAVEALQGYIQLSSITGQILHRERLDVFPGERIVRSFDALRQAPPGIYILVLQMGDRLLARKLIKTDR